MAGPVFLLACLEFCQPLSSSTLPMSLHRLKGGNSEKDFRIAKPAQEQISCSRGSGCGSGCRASLGSHALLPSCCRAATACSGHVPVPVSTRWEVYLGWFFMARYRHAPHTVVPGQGHAEATATWGSRSRLVFQPQDGEDWTWQLRPWLCAAAAQHLTC